ncbi:uncharacterized protein LOC126735355 [Anthonomus grandis grandis]|uniref:uncharacterized protein LOC126735355 n=1 Tax=Anthonomus grandis grandis TaxID=2921223 RepID=UPI00216680F4|nr:uncharacterized protein LOC126735355 [Anthonomus grandis grandis]
MKCFYVILFVLLVVSPSRTSSAQTKKNDVKSSKETSDVSSEKPPPAIIAIEIVDPNENSTSAKNSKRTIDSALGYGYNTYDTSKQRYEIYKYSQHDIPPYKGSTSTAFKPPSKQFSPVNVQQSIQYSLPTITQHIPNMQSILSPGTTLYSSLNSQGHVGGLTSSLSKVSGIDEQNGSPVPVIVLRIYPDQLKDSTIQANLPDSHPFAKSVNSINIQSLLSHYIKALRNPTPETSYEGQGQYTSQRFKGQYHTPNDGYQQQSPQYQQYQQAHQYYTQESYDQPEYQTSQPDSGNYQYYRQVYPEENRPTQESYQQYSAQGVQVQEAPAKYQFRYVATKPQKQAPSKPTVQPTQEPQQQYYYVTPSNYPQDSAQYYQLPQESPVSQQYYPAEQQQYQPNYESNPEQYYSPSQAASNNNEKLLTEENYPGVKHTKVIFRTKNGGIRTTQQDLAQQNKVKTIKIHVPNDIAKVEVQESEKAYQGQPETYLEQQPTAPETYEPSSPNANQQNKYVLPQQEYYTEKDTTSSNDERGYNYQNIDYDQMIRYFQQRSAMPSYFYQNPEEKDSKTLPSEDVIAAYEEAAFPSTTGSPEKKRKVKGKKRT